MISSRTGLSFLQVASPPDNECRIREPPALSLLPPLPGLVVGHYQKEGQRVNWLESVTLIYCFVTAAQGCPILRKPAVWEPTLKRQDISVGNGSSAFVKHFFPFAESYQSSCNLPSTKNLDFHKMFQERICHILWYIPPFSLHFSVRLLCPFMTLNALQFTESLCLDILSLDWLRVRFLTNVAGMQHWLGVGKDRRDYRDRDCCSQRGKK